MPIPTQLKPQKLVAELRALRELGVQANLSDILKKKEYREYYSNPDEAYGKYLYDAGISRPGAMTVKQFLTLEGDEGLYIFSELVLDLVVLGMEQTFPIEDLLAISTNATSDTITLPTFEYVAKNRTYGKDKDVSAGVLFEDDGVIVGDKRVDVKKFGRALKLPYEVIEDTPLDILSVYYQAYGAAIGADKFAYLIDTMINGDGGIDREKNKIDDTVATIGVQDTTKSIQFRDINRASIRLSKRGRMPESLVIDELESYDLLELPEYKERKQGVPDQIINIKGQYRTPVDFYFSNDEVGTKSALIFSKQFCTGQFKRRALMIEEEQIKSRQIRAMYASERVGLMNFFKDARIKIDGTKAFTSNGFPDWLKPPVRG